MNIDSKQVQKLLISDFHGRLGHKLCVNNIYLYDHESDFISVSNNNLVTEVEIKVSRFDYFQDFNKESKHSKLQLMNDLNGIPNYFYYCFPENLASEEEIPEYAGLIVIKQTGMNKYIKMIKKAPELHNLPILTERFEEIAIKLFNKLYL